MEKKTTKEMRLQTADYEVREAEDGGMTIEGYALKFDRPSQDMGFTEFIDKRALDQADMDNVVALINHDENYVLGRTGKNLLLSVDSTGLYFRLTPVNTSYARDLMENMKNGLMDKCSFAFTLGEDGDHWEKKDGGQYERTITNIEKLWDVSVVTTPAYEDTIATLNARSLEKVKQKEKEDRERELLIMEAELL